VLPLDRLCGSCAKFVGHEAQNEVKLRVARLTALLATSRDTLILEATVVERVVGVVLACGSLRDPNKRRRRISVAFVVPGTDRLDTIP